MRFLPEGSWAETTHRQLRPSPFLAADLTTSIGIRLDSGTSAIGATSVLLECRRASTAGRPEQYATWFLTLQRGNLPGLTIAIWAVGRNPLGAPADTSRSPFPEHLCLLRYVAQFLNRWAKPELDELNLREIGSNRLAFKPRFRGWK